MKAEALETLLRRLKIDDLALSACRLPDRRALVSRLRRPGDDGYLAVCRNGVYRSSLCSLAMQTEGLPVLSQGTHTGQSYRFLLEQLRSATPTNEGGLCLPSYPRSLRTLILCIDPESRDEREELAPALDWLSFFKNDQGLTELRVAMLLGREEDHLYY